MVAKSLQLAMRTDTRLATGFHQIIYKLGVIRKNMLVAESPSR